MTKTEIAKTIVDICKHDASFRKDISGGDSSAFLAGIHDDMPEKEFIFSVEKYLATFKVWGHLYFYKKGAPAYIGFRVRRCDSGLFVTYAERDLPLKKGDEIVAVDGMTIESAADKFAVLLSDDPPDRQGERWETIIAHADTITVRSINTFDYAVRTDIERGSGEPSSEYKFIERDIYYIKLNNFFDEQNISEITERASKDITATDNLIIDLRNNCGGSDLVFLPLLKFLLAKNDIMCGKPIFTSEDEILYTERNAKERIKIYKEYLESAANEEFRRYLMAAIDEQKSNMGMGFLPAKADNFLFPDVGTEKPSRVIVLTDYYCGSSAESFVEIASKLSKVTLLGRPTFGANDYANLSRCDFGEYVLHYPTSRSKAIDAGRGTRGKGIAPDIYVPWTPKHIFEDVDLAAATKLLHRGEEL